MSRVVGLEAVKVVVPDETSGADESILEIVVVGDGNVAAGRPDVARLLLLLIH